MEIMRGLDDQQRKAYVNLNIKNKAPSEQVSKKVLRSDAEY